MGLDPNFTPMQVKDLIKQEGVTPDAMRMRFSRLDIPFSQNRILTNIELVKYRAKYPEVLKEETPATTRKLMEAKPNKYLLPQIGIYDLLMWADWALGTYSLTVIFGPLAGLLVGVKTTLFGEATRRIMRRQEIAIPEYGHPNFQAALEQSEAVRRTKTFVSSMSVGLSLMFCWANGQTFFRSILAHTPDLAITNIADYAARTFAVAVTAIALASMYTLALQAKTKPNKNGK